MGMRLLKPSDLPQVFRDIIDHDARRPVLQGSVVPLASYRKWKARHSALIAAANLYRKSTKPSGPKGPQK